MSYIETTRMVTAMHAFGPTDVRIRGMYFERTVQIVRLGTWNLIVKDYSALQECKVALYRMLQ